MLGSYASCMLNDESLTDIPSTSGELADAPVRIWHEPVTIDTYDVVEPSGYPAYLDTRVYQGSSGRVYPMPFYERISATKAPRAWDAVHLENEYVSLVVLPELGGRIHHATDKSTGYDFFYRNTVMKPALVGLLGPWISGGVEFNWPQHHRPGTYLPTDVAIEREDDGSVTVWCSDHDPFTRMKGMHGIRLRPHSAVIEARVRLFNRTDDVQTFLWWANVAAEVNDEYQSFFPTDMTVVADHAKRAITTFPHATTPYYGIDYPSRVDAAHPDADRLDWYRNIPVPTSYMCVGTQDDFFGGYDHGVGAGFVYWADHRVAPGKKQWTWGNSEFGDAWNRNLTDTEGPYIELMAGAFTDNQPDFSYLHPGETKTFSQFWYPIQRIGTVQQATREAAVHLELSDDGLLVSLGVAVTRPRSRVRVRLFVGDGRAVWEETRALEPGAPLAVQVPLADEAAPTELELVVHDDADGELLRWRPRPVVEQEAPAPATEPVAPVAIETVEELYLTGVHLEQYRHATRSPEPYWREALRRDPSDTRSNVALAARLTRRGELAEAEGLLRTAIERLTARNPNPADSEAHYRLGVLLVLSGRLEEAYDVLAKAAWVSTWRAPAWLAMARVALALGDAPDSLELTSQVLAVEHEHLQARAVRALALRALGRDAEAEAVLSDSHRIDPVDWWTRDLMGKHLDADAQTCVDVALEYASAGSGDRALAALDRAEAQHRDRYVQGEPSPLPLIHYHRAKILADAGRPGVEKELAGARSAEHVRCFPGRLADALVLEWAIGQDRSDARAHALLGHWLYAHDRHEHAVAAWTRAVELSDDDPVVRRNLGLAAFNVAHDTGLAARHYRRALELSPADAKLLYESDQLDGKRAVAVDARLERLERAPELLDRRDDLAVVYAQLLTLTGRVDDAIEWLSSRDFQPWEGGEGVVLSAWEVAHVTAARTALAHGEGAAAEELVRAALVPPRSIGEARHPLANCADLLLALGDALAAQGRPDEARKQWALAASSEGDFLEMSTAAYSTRSVYSALALRRLDEADRAETLLRAIEKHALELAATPRAVDYFATSLPTMLLFHDDLAGRSRIDSLVLRAQVAGASGDTRTRDELLAQVMTVQPDNVEAHRVRREIGNELA